MEIAEQVMADTIVEVLERAAYLFVTPSSDEDKPFVALWFKAQCAFTKPVSGRVYIAVEPVLAFEIAENMLGDEIDHQDGITAARDALGEVLNMACGRLGDHLLTSGLDYSLPSVIETSILGTGARNRMRFQSESGHALEFGWEPANA